MAILRYVDLKVNLWILNTQEERLSMVVEIMQWFGVCFSGFSGVGPIHQKNGNLDRFVYRDILEEKMIAYILLHGSSMNISIRQ